MSRQQFKHGKYSISFGWDRSLDTFFAQAEATENNLSEEPLLWLGSERGEYRDMETFKRALSEGLLDIEIDDFVLTERQLNELQAARDENPSGAGVAEKSPAIRDLMDIFNDE